ncbi:MULTISPECIES: hypothetical protein [Streptomycetaceae]|uniref:Prephenate dehydratase n=1 Tax=Streptantibioticus cattleyicolor (strain ATCC 35852 / DSM 46488 / JCM 4925 / NBRC 14057 / NRRL 8057) TaxID=1003195 RepID=F8K1M0_STREN|nr:MULTISPECIES: hypothetical protein [Streptomycetaceae]AEW95052.1 hypothetical protein SCATT_26810 [Streptantibioticus cattleyicolor NRRL 8057 = DSM 46488]MYS59649.1 hypothetical protein [Streptomyces sp. SID5468]CCB75402.1 conserved protein of unknown function [Streptantibioticus cattleyicolor NRRL 8057 = DSM 46488]
MPTTTSEYPAVTTQAGPDWLTRDLLTRHPARRIGTLGPKGTSSEEAARYLWARLPEGGPHREPLITLYDSYEAAGEALRTGQVSHVVVANAYSAVNEFYMDTRISLAAAFIMETPEYGIAKLPGSQVPAEPTVASHPAPVPLVAQLLPAPYRPRQVDLVPSTSAAAMAARELRADLALTTAPAAGRHGLEFISRTRTIVMVWSVFVPADDAVVRHPEHEEAGTC